MLKVTITTATPLSEKDLVSFQQALEKKTNQRIEFEKRIDPKVIGGVKIKIGSKIIDTTILNKLIQIKKQLIKQL